MNNYQEKESKSTKICTKCNCEKEIIEFNKSKKGKHGLQSICKNCNKEYRIHNKDIASNYNKNYRKNNKEKIKECKLVYSKNNKTKIQENKKRYYKNNKDKIENFKTEYRKNNKGKILEAHNKYRKERYSNNLNYKISCILRSRLRHALKSQGATKNIETLELIGCSIEEFKLHIKSLFKEGMTWDNHSFEGWHIDHIKPMASFNLSDTEELKECCNYTNLQPLWAFDNLSKGDR